MARLGDFVVIRTGKLDANAASANGKYPFFTCAVEPLRIDKYSYDCECVLVAGNGDLNIKYYDGKFDAYQRTYIIESLDEEILTVRYLYYFLDKYVEKLREMSIGGVIKYIKLGNLTEAQISIPNKKEQKKIISKLKKYDSIITLRKQQLSKLDELIKSQFIEMFGPDARCYESWPVKKVEDISEDMRTGPFGSALLHSEFVDSGVFVLGIDNAVENRFSFNRMRYITEEKYEQLRRYTVNSGDVIITIMGTVGRSAVIPDEFPKAINTKHLACLTLNKKVADPHFICYAFQHHPVLLEQLHSQSKGAIMDGLNLTIIKNLRFSLPPLRLQQEFISLFKQVDKSKFEIQKSLEKLGILKRALMQQYFG